MTIFAEPGGMPVDDDVVGRISDHKICLRAIHETLVVGCDQ
jgi:hypothetical protein